MLYKLCEYLFDKKSGNTINLCLVFLLLISLGCACGKKYNRAEIPPGEILPIDGVWSLSNHFDMVVVKELRVEKGRAFCTDTVNSNFSLDAIVLKDIKQDGNKYTATLIDGVGVPNPVTLNIVSASEIRVQLSLGSWTLRKISLDNEQSFLASHKSDIDKTAQPSPNIAQTLPAGSIPAANNGVPGSPALKTSSKVELVTFDEKLVKAQEETRSAGKGSILEKKWTRTIETTVYLESLSGVEKSIGVAGEIKGDLGILLANAEVSAQLKADIKSKVEEKLGRTFKQIETIEQMVILDGNKARQWKLIWYDRIRNGTAKFTDENGKIYEIPYQITVGSELSTETIQ